MKAKTKTAIILAVIIGLSANLLYFGLKYGFNQPIQVSGWTVQKAEYSHLNLTVTLSCDVNITYAVESLQIKGQLQGQNFYSDKTTFTPIVMNAGDTFTANIKVNMDIAKATDLTLWIYFEESRYMVVPFPI